MYEKEQNTDYSETDPRSNNYVRLSAKPKIHIFDILRLVLPISCFAVLSIVFPKQFFVWLILFLLYSLLSLKFIILFAIKVYQRVAPDSIRGKCRFEPSCSQYMILAIEKYGLFVGLKKGINRLKRCHIPNGGYDWP